MKISLIPASLRPIAEKIEANERISEQDALQLYRSNDLNALGIMASAVRERKNGNVATYILNRYINYSNICVLSCQFCAFAAKKRDAHAFESSIDEIVAAVQDALASGITEVHMVGGLHPTLGKQWYLDLLTRLRALDPQLQLKAFTAIEIRHMARRIFKTSIAETLAILRAAGLGSLTGGGAEIFDPAVRDELCRGKENAAEWLEVHRTWHEMGGRSTCTMLYGHIETLEQRVDHLRQLRELQDETHGFTGFIPFAFEPARAPILAHITPPPPSTSCATSRSAGFISITSSTSPPTGSAWVCRSRRSRSATASTICTAPSCEEKIFHMAGANTPEEQTVAVAPPRHPRSRARSGPARQLLQSSHAGRPAHARRAARRGRTCLRLTMLPPAPPRLRQVSQRAPAHPRLARRSGFRSSLGALPATGGRRARCRARLEL